MSINAELRAFFSKKGMTQKQIAEKIGTTQPAVALMLSRDYVPNKTAKKLEDAFGLSYVWLRTGEGPMMVDGSNPIAPPVPRQPQSAQQPQQMAGYQAVAVDAYKIDTIMRALQSIEDRISRIEAKDMDLIAQLINERGRTDGNSNNDQ